MGVLSNFAEKVSAILFRSGPVFVRQSGDSQTSWNSIGIVSDPRISWKPVSTAKSNTGREHALGADFEVSFKMLQTGYGTEFANIDALINVPLDVKFCDERLSLAGVGTAGVNSADGVMISGVSMVASAEVDFQGGESGIILEFMFRLTVDDFNRYLIGSNWTLGITEDVTTPVQFAWQPLYDGLVPKVGTNGVDREKSFSRASTATYVDGGGIVRTAKVDEPRYTAAGVPIVEAAATNLCADSVGTTANTANFTRTSGVDSAAVAPDGSMTAQKIVEDSSVSLSHFWYDSGGGMTVSPNSTYTYSAYYKAGERNWIKPQPQVNGVGYVYVYFNLSTGEVGSQANSGEFAVKSVSMGLIGNGWYRCAVTFTTGATGGAMLDINSLAASDGGSTYTGDGSSGLYFWGRQLEAHDGPPTSYIPTSGATGVRSADVWAGAGTFTRSSAATYVKDGVVKYAGTDEPRIQDTGLLLEPSRENFMPASRPNATDWAVSSYTLTENYATAPDGTLTASRLEAVSGAGYLADSGSGASVSVAVEPSVWVKAISSSGTFRMLSPWGVGMGNWTVDVSLLGSDWVRLTSSHPAVTITTAFVSNESGGAGFQWDSFSTAIEIYLWGAQAEAGSYPTSYIPTAGSSVVRSRDALTMGTPTIDTSNDFTVLFRFKDGVNGDGENGSGDTYLAKQGSSLPKAYLAYKGTGIDTFTSYAAGTNNGYFASTSGDSMTTDSMWQEVESFLSFDEDTQAQATTTKAPFADSPTLNTFATTSGAVFAAGEDFDRLSHSASIHARSITALAITQGALTPAQIRKYLR